MSYDKYVLKRAQEHRERQVAEAAEHRLGRSAKVRARRRALFRPVGRLFVRIGRALGDDADPTVLQPARTR